MDSLLDSCTSYKDYINYAVELGQKAIGFSEHGNIYNWQSKWAYCKEKGIKYIHGIEIYLTETLNEKIRDNYHTILIAKNKEGFKELNTLYFLSTRPDHVYYKPRLTFDEFLNISDNIIKISACIQSPLYTMYKDIREKMDYGVPQEDRQEKFIQLLNHYDYYEIQYHNMNNQIEYNQWLYEWSQMYNKPLIAATDTHSLNDYKAECRTILQYGKTDGTWGDEENECDLTYKTYSELVEAFKIQNSLPMNIILEAIENTNIMADDIEELDFDTKDKYPILYGDKDEEKLWETLRIKYQEKLERGEIEDNPKYWENINEEMRVFKKINMIGFMLLMSEIMSWARSNNIATGFSRGSVGGSTVAYISDITDIDPIKWHTVFSRFANEYRVEAGDIDTDWYEDDRPKVYDYIINRFGKENTSYILAVGTLADKAIIDTIGKAFRVKTDNNTEYTLDKIKEIKKEYETNPQKTKEKYKDLFYYYDGLSGCIVSQSQHPAGLIVSPITLADNYGMFYGSEGQQILPLDMEECHSLGLIKFDILGLKSVGVIDKTCKLIGTYFPRAYEVNWNDKEVFEDITQDSTAIFQFESDFGKQSIKKMHPMSVDDICLCSACLRPSGESYREQVYNRQWNKNPSKIIDDLLSDSYGFLVYQEQTIAFLQQICGFSGSEADNIRRAIGKKQKDKIDKALPQILEGYCNKSDKPREIAETEAKQFLKVIEDASGYSFNFNHAESYAMLGYLMGYLRYYYPIEFITSFLNCAENNEDINNGTLLAKNKNIKIERPIFRYSTSEYGYDINNKTIYKGIGSIKNISEICGNNLYTLKDKIYSNFIELLYDIFINKLAQKNEIDKLIKINFFREFGDINQLLVYHSIFLSLYKRKTLKSTELDVFGITLENIKPYIEKATEKTISGINMPKVIEVICSNQNYEPITNIERISYDMGILNHTDIIDNTIPNNIFVVGNIETNKYGTKFITVYHPQTGEYYQNKVKRSAYNYNPCDSGDIIKAVFNTQYKRKKNENDEWVQSEEQEEILKNYTIIKKFE
jgi:DNA polymerase-3 subunit alpha